MELRPASGYDLAALADLFTRGYENYVIPFALNEDVYSPIRLEAFAEQTQEFATAVTAGFEAATPALRGADGRAAVEIVEAGARSSASGEAIRLPIDPA